MKITEELYIERLEEMIKLYPDNVCDHCPMSSGFDSNYSVMTDPNIANYGLSCDICNDLHSRYTGKGKSSGEKCPCKYFNEDGKTDMVAIAWKVIHGWRKDHE